MSDFDADYFSSIMSDFDESTAQQARRVVLAASGEDADKAAKATNLAQDLGVPKQAVQYDLEHYEREKNFGADYFTKLGNRYPTMIDFMSDPDNAAIVHDDMTYLEKTAKTLVQVPGQVKEGYDDLKLAKLRNKQMYGAATEQEIAYANQLSQRQRVAPEPTGFISDTALKVANQAPILAGTAIESMAYSVAAGAAAFGVGMLTAPVIPEEIVTVPMAMRAGGAYGAFNFSRGVEGGLAFDEFISFKDADGQSLDEDVARGAAMIVGITNGAVELIPLKKLAETVPGIEKLSQYFTKDGLKQALKYPSVREALSDIGQRYAKAIVAEGSTEIAQEAVTMYTGELIKAIDDGEFDALSVEEQIERLAEAGKAGAQVAAGLGFAGTAVRTGQVIAEQTGQPNPMKVAEYVRNARETLADSGGKLMTRSKPKMREYIDGVTQGQTFYLDAGATSALYQKMSEEQKQQIINAIPDFEASLDGAVRTKDSFEIPAADFFTYIQPFDEAGTLDEHVTLSPEHYSAADLNEIDEMISDLMDEAQALEEQQTDGDVVESNIYQQLLQNFNGRKAPSGRVDVARLMSQNPRAFYETMLDRSNQDPRVKEILDRLVRDVVIRRQVPNLQRVLKIDELDLALDRVRDRVARRAAAQEAGQSPDMFGRVQTKKRKGKAKPTPVISWLGKRVGIRHGGAAARELAAMDITPKSHPRLFKAKGIGSVDNIPASEFNDEIGNQIGLIAQEDENGYVDQEWLLEQLRNESFGEGALTQEQMDAETEQAYLDDIEQVMQMVGVDLDMPNADIKAELQRYQDELAQDFDSQQLYQEAREKELVVRHNVSARGIENIEKIGGLPVPSLAIMKYTELFDNFGDITLIGDVSLIDPKTSAKNKVFGADVYSPRYPSVSYQIDDKEFNKAISSLPVEQLKEYGFDRIDSLYSNLEDRGMDELFTSDELKASYLMDKNELPDIPYAEKKKTVVDNHPALKKFVGMDYFDLAKENQEFIAEVKKILEEKAKKFGERVNTFLEEDGQPNFNILMDYAKQTSAYNPEKSAPVDYYELRKRVNDKIEQDNENYEQWVADKFENVIQNERIFDGFTPSGNRRYLPHNLDSVVKILRRGLRDGEGFNYGLPSVRSKVAKEFKSVKQIKDNADLLVSDAEFEKIKKEMDNEFMALGESLRPYSPMSNDFGFLDAYSEHLKEIAEGRSIDAVLNDYYADVPEFTKQEVIDFLAKLENMPTEYFEAKIQRAVQLSEFTSALVPEGSSFDKAAKILDKNGVDVIRFDKNDKAAKQKALESQSQVFFQNQGEDARGSIEFTSSGQSIIRLFEKEDLSTFMHEAGHLYWRAMSEIAALDNAPEQIAQDVATVHAWVGAKDGETLTVEQEEKIADAFLEYIRKGDAPSVDLQSAFQRMKGWLMRIYRGVRDTLPKINKEISDVFDRMLATDDAIERVRTEPTFRIDEAIIALLPKAQADRMRKKYEKSVEHAKERILKKAIRQAEAKATKTYKAERAAAQARITNEVEQERTYAAMDKILEEGGLSRKGVTQIHGKEAVPYLSGHGGLVKKDGQHPDVYADLLGYSNGYEMLMDFMNAEKKKDRINRLTDQAMLERYGDMLNDGSIDDEAMRIYHNRLQKEVIALEMKALAELGSIPAPDPDGIEAAAIKLVGDLQISKLQPGRYLRAENRAYFDYGKALGQGNYARAARAKAQQLLNHHMYVMTADARETVEKSVKGWRRFGRPDKKIAKAKSINIDYVYAIRAILARHDIGRSDFAFNDWFEQLRAESPDSAQTLAQLINMNTEGAKPYKDLSVDEFMGLKDSIEGLIELGRDTLKIELDGKRLTAREAAQAAADTIYDNNKERDMSKHYEGLMDKARELVAGFDVSVTRMEFILKALEGNEVNGKLAQMFINPLAKAEAAEQAMHQDIAEKFREIIKKNGGVGNRWKQKVYDQRLDGSFTVRNIVTIALNMGNEGNLEKLLDGYNWEYADVKGIVERYLTKEDMDTVQEIWDLMEQLRPDLQRVHKEVTGFPMEIVRAQPLETKWGTYKGGYFPVVYDVKRSDIGARNAEDISVFESNFTIPSVGKGMTKSRSSFSAPVDLDFESIVSGHFAKTIHLITHGTAVKDLNRIILNPIFKEAILNTAGVQVYSQFKPWLQAIASNRVYDNPVKAQDKVVRHLRVATTNLFLGFSVTTGIKQTLGMTATYASVLRGEVTQKNFFKSLRQYYTDPANMSKFVMENSAEMQGRIRKMDANVAMVMSSVSKLNTTYDKVMYAGMAFNSYSQMYTVDMPTWIAGYNQGMEKYAGNHEQAVNYADALVRQTQGSGAVKDLSVFQRGTETEKAAWAMFGTYIIGVLYPKLRELGIDTTRGHVARSAMALTSLLFVPAILEGLMSDPPDDDEGLLEWTLLKSMLYGASSLPIIGGIVQGYAGDFGYSMSAIESPINMVIKNIQSDDPEKFTKGLVVGVGLATKLPVYKPYQALDELIDQASGEEDVNIPELLQIVKDSDR